MMTKPGNRPESHGDGPDPERVQRRKEAANARTRRAERAARTDLRGGPIVRHTPRGEVTIREVRIETTPDGLEYLVTRTAPGAGGETEFRIFNVPTGVLEPDGTVREDPLGALVEVLALHGGARQSKRRRFR